MADPKQKPTERQHWLARFYLKQFAEPMFSDNLCVYEFAKRTWDTTRTPKGVGWSPHLCSMLDMDGSRTDQYDQFFKVQIEDPAAPAMRKLAVGEQISDAEREAVALFVGLTYARGPDLLNGVTTQYLGELDESQRKELDQFTKQWCEITNKDIDQNSLAHFVKPGVLMAIWVWSKSIQQRLIRWKWRLIRTTREMPFVTTDRPLMAEREVDQDVGLVTFPVSSEIALMMFTGGVLNPNRDPAEEIRQINLRSIYGAKRFVIACRNAFPGDDALAKRAATKV
jgi:hypothetical protein